MRVFLRPRLLPIVIVAAALLLSMKIGELWREGGKALADTQPPPAAPSAPSPTATPSSTSTLGPSVTPASSPSAAEKKPSHADEADQSYSPDDLKTFQQLSSRRAELDKRAAALDQRELLLKAVDAQLNEKIQTLHQKQAELDSMLGKVDDQTDERLKSLVKIYETMKPADAARIFDQMDMPILIQLLTRMKEQKTASILAGMSPVKAKSITIEMASKQTLPADLKSSNQVN